MTTGDKQLFVDSMRIAPDKCRMIGKIVAIDPVLSTADPKDPCAKVPCRATVQVDSILGYGHAFPRPLAKGERISVEFAFTLGASSGLFSNMTQSFPGLRVGSTFLADVDATGSAKGSTSRTPGFVVYGYEVRN